MKKLLTQKELAVAAKEFSRFQEEIEKETQIKKNELTIEAIDTLILNSLWDEDLPMTAHIKSAAFHGHLPPDFDRWDLKDIAEWSVRDIYDLWKKNADKMKGE